MDAEPEPSTPARIDASEELLRRATGGDAAAFEQLFRLHGERLRRSARARLPSALLGRVDGSDVVQDALLDAVRGLRQFEPRGEGSFRRWLDQVLRNRLLMTVQHYLGRKRRDVRRETRLGDGGSAASAADRIGARELPSPRSSPSAGAARSEERERIERSLASLPADYATVLRLVRLEERGIAEAARSMGRSENAVKKLLARALVALRDALDADRGAAPGP